MYEQICFFISTHFFIQLLIFVLALLFGCLGAISLILAIIGSVLNIIDNNNSKEDWLSVKAFCLIFIFSILTGLLPFITVSGLQKYEVQKIKNNWLITKNKKIIYLNKLKIIKTNKLSPGFYYTLIGTQVKIEAIPITQSLPVVDYYDSLYVLSNGKIIKTKKVIIKKIRVDSWAQSMSTKWKIKHYSFYRWEWPYGLSWKKKGKLIKYTI